MGGWMEEVQERGGEEDKKKGKQRKTKARQGRRWTRRASYLGLSVLADRIGVFSIYANRSHRRRIITALCQVSPPPSPHPPSLSPSSPAPIIPPSTSPHPLLWPIPRCFTFPLGRNPCFSSHLTRLPFLPLPSASPNLIDGTVERHSEGGRGRQVK